MNGLQNIIRPGLTSGLNNGLDDGLYNGIQFEPNAKPLLLDKFPNAAAAYSLRKISILYNGPCIRVRRTGDNIEQDIDFDGDGNLNINQLLSFIGNNNALIRTWYDQSGNNRNAIQTNLGTQPQIVNAGQIIYQNNKPTIKFDNTDDALIIQNSGNLIRNTGFGWVFTVYINNSNPNNANGLRLLFISNGINANAARLSIVAGVQSGKVNIGGRRLDTNSFQGLNSISSVDLNKFQLLSCEFNYFTNLLRLYTNNIIDNELMSFQTSGFTSDTSSISAIIGAQGGTPSNMNISEIIIYNKDQSTNRINIEKNINNYYKIY